MAMFFTSGRHRKNIPDMMPSFKRCQSFTWVACSAGGFGGFHVTSVKPPFWTRWRLFTSHQLSTVFLIQNSGLNNWWDYPLVPPKSACTATYYLGVFSCLQTRKLNRYVHFFHLRYAKNSDNSKVDKNNFLSRLFKYTNPFHFVCIEWKI